MTQRERILAAVVLGVLVLWGGKWMWEDFGESQAALRGDLVSAQNRLSAAKLSLAKGQSAARNLSKWQQQSLPINREVAQSLYRSWLQERFEKAGLKVEDIQPNQRTVPAEAYTAIGITVTASGTLKSLTTLLYDFYSSPLLQQITRLQLTPERTNPNRLNITFQAEALILPGTDNESLPSGTSDRLADTGVDEFAGPIADRNLFATYRPPRPEPPPAVRRERLEPPKFDDAKFAYVTGTVEVNGRLQAWITVRTTGEVVRLFEGDPVKIGLLEGRVVSIEPLRIVIETDDQELQVKLGDNLREGVEVPEPQEG